MERNAHPRMAYFMRWCRESLEDGVFPRYEDFAEQIHVSKQTVSRIRRQAIAEYVKKVESVALLVRLYTEHPDAIAQA
jgi:hypothetical protein